MNMLSYLGQLAPEYIHHSNAQRKASIHIFNTKRAMCFIHSWYVRMVELPISIFNSILHETLHCGYHLLFLRVVRRQTQTLQSFSGIHRVQDLPRHIRVVVRCSPTLQEKIVIIDSDIVSGRWLEPGTVSRSMLLGKQGVDMQCNAIAQTAMAKNFAFGGIDRHIKILQATGQNPNPCRRDLAIRCVENEYPRNVELTRPEGGLFLRREYRTASTR